VALCKGEQTRIEQDKIQVRLSTIELKVAEFSISQAQSAQDRHECKEFMKELKTEVKDHNDLLIRHTRWYLEGRGKKMDRIIDKLDKL